MLKLCVFSGSSNLVDQKFLNLAKELGYFMGDHKMELVYGGAKVGAMGAMADGLLEKKGKVWGVIPKHLMEWEVAHEGITHLDVVDTMHERKAKMYDLSDAFLAFPGGLGTLDELCEILTWKQLKHHDKPIYILNSNGFYDHLLAHFKMLLEERFLSQEHFDYVQVIESFEGLSSLLKV